MNTERNDWSIFKTCLIWNAIYSTYACGYEFIISVIESFKVDISFFRHNGSSGGRFRGKNGSNVASLSRTHSQQVQSICIWILRMRIHESGHRHFGHFPHPQVSQQSVHSLWAISLQVQSIVFRTPLNYHL